MFKTVDDCNEALVECAALETDNRYQWLRRFVDEIENKIILQRAELETDEDKAEVTKLWNEYAALVNKPIARNVFFSEANWAWMTQPVDEFGMCMKVALPHTLRLIKAELRRRIREIVNTSS